MILLYYISVDKFYIYSCLTYSYAFDFLNVYKKA